MTDTTNVPDYDLGDYPLDATFDQQALAGDLVGEHGGDISSDGEKGFILVGSESQTDSATPLLLDVEDPATHHDQNDAGYAPGNGSSYDPSYSDAGIGIFGTPSPVPGTTTGRIPGATPGAGLDPSTADEQPYGARHAAPAPVRGPRPSLGEFVTGLLTRPSKGSGQVVYADHTATARILVPEDVPEYKPSANLMAPSTGASLAVATATKFASTVAIASLVAAVGAFVGVSHMESKEAATLVTVQQQSLEAAHQQQSQRALAAQVAAVKERLDALRPVLGSQTNVSAVLNAALKAAPAGVTVISATTGDPSTCATSGVFQPSASASPTPTAGATTAPAPTGADGKPIIGCLSLTGSASDTAMAGQYVTALGAIEGLSGAFLTNGSGVVGQSLGWTISVGYTSAFNDDRFTPLMGAQQATLASVAPSPTSASTATSQQNQQGGTN